MCESLSRREGEREFDYHRRLVYGKLVDKTLSDADYTELSRYVYGKDYSSDVCRRMLYGSCKTLQLLDGQRENEAENSDILCELEQKKIELQKERQRFFDQRSAFNKAVRERAREEELNDIIVRAIHEGALPELRYEPNYSKSNVNADGNDLLVSLNDIHYGACVDNYWCQYDSDICARMMERYLERVISIAKTHDSENCIVWANGDMISGNIHYQIAVANRENLIQQITGVSELIAEFLAELSRHFREVRFVSVAGNHSRIDQKDRAIMQERLDDLVEWYLSARMHEFGNVVIGYGDKIDPTMYAMNIRGKNYVGVHGDYDPSPANVQTLQTLAQRPVYAILLGHLHHCATNYVQGIRTVIAGSFLGMDDYCVSKRIYSKPEQTVCVCDADGIRCFYDIRLAN